MKRAFEKNKETFHKRNRNGHQRQRRSLGKGKDNEKKCLRAPVRFHDDTFLSFFPKLHDKSNARHFTRVTVSRHGRVNLVSCGNPVL